MYNISHIFIQRGSKVVINLVFTTRHKNNNQNKQCLCKMLFFRGLNFLFHVCISSINQNYHILSCYVCFLLGIQLIKQD